MIHIIHEEYADRVAKCKCFRRHEISKRDYQGMTDESERRAWKARATNGYTPIGFGAIRWSRRRWGDNRKVIDIWHFIDELPTDFEEIDKNINEII